MGEENKEKDMQTGTTNFLSLGISLGMLFGICIGSGTGNLALGMSVGILIGVLFSFCRKKNKGNPEK